MASSPENMETPVAQDPRFQTDNSVSRKPQPKQQLSKAMEHMRFAVTVDPVPHTTSTPTPPLESSSTSTQPTTTSSDNNDNVTSEPTENDAYGVPASIAPVRAPASRSHDPSNNQKRSDPFSFGSRYLEEGDNIFEFNAWDHVVVDSSYAAFSEEQYSKQRESPVNDFDRQRYNAQPEKWWNQFYKNNKTNFFKNRKWLAQEFPILNEVGKEDAPAATILEVGAGAGNSAFPILQNSKNPRLKIHACDFSKKAVDLIRAHELYDEKLIQADVWDVASSPDSDNAGLPPGLSESSVDVVLMIFIFSALAPTQWDAAVRNIWRVLKPGGQVLFRDYGRGDLAQVRFKKGRYLEENFYVRGDGTRVYFFEKDELEEIWGGKRDSEALDTRIGDVNSISTSPPLPPSDIPSNPSPTPLPTDTLTSTPTPTPAQPPSPPPSHDHPTPIDIRATPTTQSSITDVSNPHTPRPIFQIAHIGVDRRMLVNRQRRLKMYRCWMQAVFRKDGELSTVPTSTLRVEGGEGGKEEETGQGEGVEEGV